MKIYTLETINDLKNKKNFELDLNVVNFLNTTLNDIKKQSLKKNEYGSFVDKNKSKFNKYKNNEKKIFDNKNITNITNNYSNKTLINIEKQNDNITKNRINRIKVLNNTNSIDAINNNIRKILNKLSNTNYDKLKNEFICYYNTLLTNEIELNEINNFIFTMLTKNNEIFSELYSSIYANLININNDFSIILSKNINEFLNFTNNVNYESISNKKNDEYRCLLLFYINCIKKNLLPSDFLFDIINNLFMELFDNIKIENNKITCEVLNEIIFFIITSSYDNIVNDNNYNKIYENITNIKKMKNNDLPSISNKIIFKNMDLYDKYKPNTL
jgi:hypothetical protein